MAVGAILAGIIAANNCINNFVLIAKFAIKWKVGTGQR
jgi:hypothetical protein